MNLQKFTCNSCGWIGKIDLDNLPENTIRCPICNNKEDLKPSQEDKNEALFEHFINSMIHNLDTLGENRVWTIINNMENETRLGYIELYLNAKLKLKGM